MKVYLIIILSLFYVMTLSAQTTDTVSRKQYESLVEDLKYEEVKKEWVPREFQQGKGLDFGFLSFFNGLFSIIGYGLIALIIGGIIYKIAKEFSPNEKAKSKTINLDEIEDIENIDLEALLKEALQEKDFRLALRLQFLIVIQSLTSRDLLIWKPYKTNRAFVNELKGHSYQKPFKELADIFEYTWYGITEVNGESYDSLSIPFHTFIKKNSQDEGE